MRGNKVGNLENVQSADEQDGREATSRTVERDCSLYLSFVAERESPRAVIFLNAHRKPSAPKHPCNSALNKFSPAGRESSPIGAESHTGLRNKPVAMFMD